MTRQYEDSPRELFDADGGVSLTVAKRLFEKEDNIITILEHLDSASFERAKSAIKKVSSYRT
ncbi:hypothetical protein [Aeromonas veronii]|uniref:hypothetical protein n=1 Tax=Aeromonas veronii TaxID=654 RepID=UPI001068C4A8|nr:hypothetical protein [Aeromonas veronii]